LIALGIVGLLLAIALLILLCYKGFAALPATVIAAIVAILFNGMPIWESYSKFYISGYTVAFAYFFMIISAALFAKMMELSGSAQAIAFRLIDWFGDKRAMLVSVLLVSVLTYGGVSVMVVVLVAGPIMFMLFERAGLPRHLTMAALLTGAATYTLTALPGVPTTLNVIPTQYLGTTMTAAPLLGIICAIAMFILCMAYCTFAEKKARKLGETFSYPADSAMSKNTDRKTLPAAWKAFVPILVVVLGIIIGSQFTKDAFMLSTGCMLLASLLIFLLNISGFKGKDPSAVLQLGLSGGLSAISNIAAVLGFGAVIQNTPAFAAILGWILTQNMNPYVLGVFTTSVFCGITGSSGGGIALAYKAIGPMLENSSCNMEIMHRLTAMASGSLDSLPHSVGVFLPMAVLGLTHKDSYKHAFAVSVIVPVIVVSVATAVCVLLGL